MSKKNNEISIRSSAAEYLTFVAATGDSQDSFEMRYEDENIWLTRMYKKMGFHDDGIADSTWGGEEWHQMTMGSGLMPDI